MATQGFVSWDVFLPEILQYCHGAPSIQVRIHIMQTVVEFCERTLVLKRDPATFLYEEDEHTYLLSYSSDRYRVVDVDECRIGEDTDSNQPLVETTEHEIETEASNWRSRTSNIPRRYWLTEDTNKIRLWPTPDQDGDEDVILRTRVTYKRDQEEIDEFIFEKWHEAIKHGALSSLLLIKGSTWYDEREAEKHSQAYRRLLRNARSVTLKGTGQYPGRVTPQSYDVMGSNYKRRSGSWV